MCHVCSPMWFPTSWCTPAKPVVPGKQARRAASTTVGALILAAVLVGCGSGTGGNKTAPSSTTAAPRNRSVQDAQAQAIIERALKVVASDYQDFGAYDLVSPFTLGNLDRKLKHASTLRANGHGRTFFIAVRSATGTDFQIHGKGTRLSRVCTPAGPGCPGGRWAGSSTLALAKVPIISAATKKKIRGILMASINHYAALLAEGERILGSTQYANATAGLDAFSDPDSAASRFSAYRKSPNPENDLSFTSAFEKADRYFTAANEPHAISDWRDEMIQAQGNLAHWVTDAVSWQIKEISTSKLEADASTVRNDLARAEIDARRTAK
jgi:hypothetical protein